MLVMRNIATYPQTFDSRYVTAESVLQQDDPAAPGRGQTGVGLVELAQVQPDGEKLKQVVDNIHSRFGIVGEDGQPINLHPRTVESFVRVGAYAAVRTVHYATYNMAKYLDTPLPKGLRQQVIPSGKEIYGTVLRPKVARQFATELHGVLQDNPKIRAGVVEYVGNNAAHVRRYSNQRQQFAASQHYRQNRGHYLNQQKQ